MLSTDAFNYVNVLNKAADASWTRESVINNNIANVSTVGYKRQDIDFQSVLREELGNCKHKSLDNKINELDISDLNAQIYTDSANYSYRLDGNNVDIDTENVELASEQIRYDALVTSINSEFSRMRAALGK